MAKINFQLTKGDRTASLVYEDKAEWTPEGICKVVEAVKSSVEHSCTCHGKAAEKTSSVLVDNAFAKNGELPSFPREYEPRHMQDGSDHFNIRQRLPNNVVDINDLTIKQATTDKALIRCPVCGQAHAVIVSDNVNLYLMRKHYATGEFGIVKSGSGIDESSLIYLSRQCNLDSENDPNDKLHFFYLCQGFPLTEDKDFAVANDTELFCPVCHKSAPFIEWKEAWQEPSKFFEYTHICEACGGECVEKIDADKKGLMVCDACGKTWLNDAPAE